MISIKKIGVLGAGQMGSGIAQVAAQAGFVTILADLKQSFLDRAKQTIEKSLKKLAEKGQLQDHQSVLEKIHFTEDQHALKDCDFVIEAATEKEETKFSIFSELDRIIKPEAYLASNTSSISITKIASKTKRPEKVIGMHFMNPVPLMTLVEIIRGLQTSDACYQTTKSIAEKMQKTTVLSQDSAGFIVNRILAPMINEAVWALFQGIATAQDIDTAMKLGTNQPMGPLALADLIGLDTVLSILEVLHAAYGEKFKPCPLLKQYVDAGWLGKKAQKGFYSYTPPTAKHL